MKNKKVEVIFEFYTVAYLILIILSAMAYARFSPLSFFTCVFGFGIIYVVNVLYRIHKNKNNID